MANDWHWFTKHWDAARLSHMHPWQRTAWGSQPRDIVNHLLDRLKRDEDILANWMHRERGVHLCEPALRL